MATTTTNLGLTKPAYADTADIAVINANMDKIDTAANGLEAGIAIVSNNNTHAAVSKGQYVYVRNHGTLSEGMYKANSNIAANGTLSSSNLTAVSGGLGADVASNADAVAMLSSELTFNPITITGYEGTSFTPDAYCRACANNDMTFIDISASVTVTGNSWNNIASIPTQYAPVHDTHFFVVVLSSPITFTYAYLTSDGIIRILGVNNGFKIRGSVMFPKGR